MKTLRFCFLSFFLIIALFNISTADDIIKNYQSAGVFSLNLEQTPFIGAIEPKIEIVLFSDYYCSHCRSFLKDLDLILNDPEYQHKVRLYYKIFPIYHNSCTIDTSFDSWSQSCKVGLIFFELFRKSLFWQFEKKIRKDSQTNLLSIVKSAEKLSQSKIELELLKEKNSQFLFKHIKEGLEMGISATPTWFINGRKIVGYYSAQELKTLIDFILAGHKNE